MEIVSRAKGDRSQGEFARAYLVSVRLLFKICKGFPSQARIDIYPCLGHLGLIERIKHLCVFNF